jgi:S1-C subfamily serine protease
MPNNFHEQLKRENMRAFMTQLAKFTLVACLGTGLGLVTGPLYADDKPAAPAKNTDRAEGKAAALKPTQAAPGASRELSATAKQIFNEAQPRLLQIRTLLKSAQKQATIGSGFLVDASGLAITNYHVVSQYALEPQTYQLEYAAADGSSGALRLYAIDVINDLAVVRLEAPPGTRFNTFEFEPVAVEGRLVKGERLFSMGNPLDLGFGIVEGTYNGLIEKSYQPQVHFTGALNPGMSGGPAVTMKNRIAGINVAKRIGGDLVSFLVPAEAAYRLLEKARQRDEMKADVVREEIGTQVIAWQNHFFSALKTQGFKETAFGAYRAAESKAAWFSCWARTNSDERPKPRTLVNRASCNTNTGIFLADGVYAGHAEISHIYLKNLDLNALQFAHRVGNSVTTSFPRRWGGGLTSPHCHEDFLASDAAHPDRPVLRLTWCARAYREFVGIYDFSLVAVTQDRNDEALISNLSMAGVSFDNAMAFTRDFLALLKADHDLD